MKQDVVVVGVILIVVGAILFFMGRFINYNNPFSNRGSFFILFGIILLITGTIVSIAGATYQDVQKEITKQASQNRTPQFYLAPAPRNILDTRYAKGEITKEQYEQMKKDLEK